MAQSEEKILKPVVDRPKTPRKQNSGKNSKAPSRKSSQKFDHSTGNQNGQKDASDKGQKPQNAADQSKHDFQNKKNSFTKVSHFHQETDQDNSFEPIPLPPDKKKKLEIKKYVKSENRTDYYVHPPIPESSLRYSPAKAPLVTYDSQQPHYQIKYKWPSIKKKSFQIKDDEDEEEYCIYEKITNGILTAAKEEAFL